MENTMRRCLKPIQKSRITAQVFSTAGQDMSGEGELLVFEDKVWVVTAVRAEKDVKETVQKILFSIRKGHSF